MKNTIDRCRQLVAAGDLKSYAQAKKRLPAFIFMSTMMPNEGKDGKLPTGAWRLQRAARLNGLVMLDFDHLADDPLDVFNRIPSHWFDDTSCRNAIMLAHRTPSGQGLRLVCTADAERGTLHDNQLFISTSLGLKPDECVKNADRMSFAVKESDIFYINDNIFDYENSEYDSKFGDFYRMAGSRPAEHSSRSSRGLDGRAATHAEDAGRPAAAPAAAAPAVAGVAADLGSGAPGAPGAEDGRPVGAAAGAAVPVGEEGAAGEAEAGLTYHGVPMQQIVDRWLQLNGTPQQGDRHAGALRMACDLRYICDNDPKRLEPILRLAPFVRDIISERGEEEVADIAKDACNYKFSMTRPRRVRNLLSTLVPDEQAPATVADAAASTDLSAHQTFWRRLEPLLTPPYSCACAGVDDLNKLGAVFVAGTMYCTLMSRCWYEHFDRNHHRMNPQAYIIGMPASGKSFADRLDEQIMDVMRSADQLGRDAESEYKRQQKERATSSKAQKGEALKRPELPIRYLPSRTSNAVFYRRLQNAHEEVLGEDMPLHLYTFDSELDSNTVAQSSGAWIGKHDIELKAFQNERTGVDFANADSVNAILPVYFNQVETGTPLSLQKKINIRNVCDGLCSRIAIFPMANSAFKMIPIGVARRNHELYCEMRQWGYRFDEMRGELKIWPLVEHVHGLCALATEVSAMSDDHVLDFLRKRAVFYAIWFTVPRIYGRQWDEYKRTGEVTIDQSDLNFATLIYDAVLYWQDYFFGSMLEEAWQNAANAVQVRKKVRVRTTEELNALPQEFTLDDVQRLLNLSKGVASSKLSRWAQGGFIKRTERGRYAKEARS